MTAQQAHLVHPTLWPFLLGHNRLVKEIRDLLKSRLQEWGDEPFEEQRGSFVELSSLFMCVFSSLLDLLQECLGSPQSTACSLAGKEANTLLMVNNKMPPC